ncbi:MAG: hypothetical protein AB1713_01040 [Pseudomonadota bacterium]
MPKAPIPHGMVVDKQTGEASPAPERVVELVLEGLEKDQAVKPLTKRVTEIKAELKELVPANSVVTIDDLAEAPITLRQQVVIVDEAALKAALGKRFVDLVNVKVEYQPTEKLIAMASDADNPQADTLRACMDVKETLSISFKSLAPAKPKRGKPA